MAIVSNHYLKKENYYNMISVNKIPKYRFNEFLDEWVGVRISEVVTFSKGKGISKSDILKNGKIKCIRYGELYTIYDQIINIVESSTDINSELVYSKGNEVLIPSSGETAIDIATASCINLEGIALGGDLNILTSKQNGNFLAYLISGKSKLNIARKAQGISVIHLYSKHIGEVNINLPSLPEQQKIADFLSTVDKKIQSLKRKKELLESYKKGVMQKIFPAKGRQEPEIRFKKDDGSDYKEWEESTLGMISNNVMYGIGSSATKFDGVNKYIRITDIDEATNTFKPSPLTSPSGEIEPKYYLKKGDIVFARTGASVGKTYLYNQSDGKLVFAGFLIKIAVNNAHDSRFVFYQTQTYHYKKWVVVYSVRSGQPGINAEEYKKFKIKLPSKEEQTKIANFLTAIDDKINVVNTQIEKMEEWKKGLLQQMFV